MARKPLPLSITVDTREQIPYTFYREVEAGQVAVLRAKLATGDYALSDRPVVAVVERKSISDLWGSVGGGRERFARELVRMRAIRWPAIVIEGTLGAVCRHNSRAWAADSRRMRPAVVVNTLIAWGQRHGVQVQYCDSRALAERWTFRFLHHANRIFEQEHGRACHLALYG
jgi:ERCC4-type nuclease